MRSAVAVITAFILLSAPAYAGGLNTETVLYKHGDTTLEGYLAHAEGLEGAAPGVVVVHDWKGLGDHYKKITEKLGDMGYVAFAADIYGRGVRPETAKEAAEEAKKYKSDRTLMRERAAAAVSRLKEFDRVDPNRIAAIGYCFGGTVVLEAARSGAPLAGVVSFHGGLSTPTPKDVKNITAKVLVLHGADDPYVPPEEAAAFREEMRSAGVDWQMNYYGGAVHSFTKPAAGDDPSKGAAYNEKADKRSWEAMKLFFEENLAAPKTSR